MQAGKAVAARGARVSLAAWAGTLLPAESSTSGASAAVVRLLARANSSCVATGARWFSAGPARWFDPRTHKPTTALENCSAEAHAHEELMPTTALRPNTDAFSLNSSTSLDPLVCIAVDDDAFLRIAHTIFFEHALGAVSD